MEGSIKQKLIATVLSRAVDGMGKRFDINAWAQRNLVKEDRFMAFVLMDDNTQKPFARQDFGLVKRGGRFVIEKYDETVTNPTVMIFCTETMFLWIARRKTNPATGRPWTPANAYFSTKFLYMVGEDFLRHVPILSGLFEEAREINGIMEE